MITEICVKTSEQISAVANLADEIWHEHYTPIIGSDQVTYMVDNFQSERAISSQIAGGLSYYLVEMEGQSVGYYAIKKESEDTLFLSKIYVHACARRKGVATWMLAHIAEKARKQGLLKVSLTVNRGNAGSIAFYERSGFMNVGPIRQNIGGGFFMDDYRMVWELVA